MSNSITFDVTLASKIKGALIRNHIPDAADLDWLAAGDNIRKVRQLRLGLAELVLHKYIIDLDAAPYVTSQWKVVSHQNGGEFKWWPDVGFYLHVDPDQEEGFGVNGDRLRSKLEKLPVLNANVLDFLIRNKNLIPEKWKGCDVCFWGTVYEDARGSFVRSLYWTGEHWNTGIEFLDRAWDGRRPAVLDARTMLNVQLKK